MDQSLIFFFFRLFVIFFKERGWSGKSICWRYFWHLSVRAALCTACYGVGFIDNASVLTYWSQFDKKKLNNYFFFSKQIYKLIQIRPTLKPRCKSVIYLISEPRWNVSMMNVLGSKPGKIRLLLGGCLDACCREIKIFGQARPFGFSSHLIFCLSQKKNNSTRTIFNFFLFYSEHF